ncbi:hypothetical protein ABN276_04685 [Providencia huaxiensis]
MMDTFATFTKDVQLISSKKYVLIENISEVLLNIFEAQPENGVMYILVKLINSELAGDYVILAKEYGLKIEY